MIQDRIKRVKELTETIKNHHMCVDMTEDKTHYLVKLPYGYSVDAIRCNKELGKANALNLILNRMNKEWHDDNCMFSWYGKDQ